MLSEYYDNAELSPTSPAGSMMANLFWFPRQSGVYDNSSLSSLQVVCILCNGIVFQ